MKKVNLKNIKKVVNTVGYKAAKHSPAILGIVGIVGFGATVYLSIKASKELGKEMDEISAKQDAWEEYKEKEKECKANNMPLPLKYKDNIPEKVTFKDVVITVSKHCALPVAVGVGTLFCFGTSYKIMSNRISGLATQVALQQLQYSTLEEKVREKCPKKQASEILGNVEVKQEAQGKREAVYKKTADRDEEGRRLYPHYWFSESEHYVSDDLDFAWRVLEDIDRKVLDYLSTHQVITLNQLQETRFLGTHDKTPQGAYLGWDLSAWIAGSSTANSGMTKESETAEVLTTIDPEDGDVIHDIKIVLPKMIYVY